MEINLEKRRKLKAKFKEILDKEIGEGWADPGDNFGGLKDELAELAIIHLVEAIEELFAEDDNNANGHKIK